MALKRLTTALIICFLFCGSRGATSSGGDYSSNIVPRSFDAKSMLTSIATNLMSRGFTSGGGSQVVSLNLTNLLVLVLLKALIFAAGSLGAGTWRGGLGRSLDGEETFVTEQELLLFLSYLTGTPGDNQCLQLISCKTPQQSSRYAAAGEMLLKASKMFMEREEDPSYKMTIMEIKRASNYGQNGGDCSRFSCDRN